MPAAKTGEYGSDIPQFSKLCVAKNIIASGMKICSDIICSSKLTIFLKLCSQKTACFSEQTLFADKYESIFLCQMEAIVYLFIKF